MIKFLVQLCLVLLLITAFAALAVMGNTKSALALWVALASFGGVALLYWYDRENDRKVKARKDAEESARLSALATRSGQNETVEVSGFTPLALALILVVAGAFVIYLFIPFPNVLALSGGILALALGGLLLLGVLRALGKPIITLSAAGFKTPLTPLVTWDLVDGIYLQQIATRYATSYLLVFRIESLQRLLPGFGMFYRLIYRLRTGAGKKRLHIALKGTSETPDFIYKLARQYWTAKTGRTRDWHPDWSEDVNQSMKEMDELKSQFKEMATSGAPPDPAAFTKVTERMARIDKGLSVEMDRSRRNLRWWNLMMYAGLALVAIGLIFKMLARWS